MNIRKIIKEEIEGIFEDFFQRNQVEYPDFLDPQFNPLVKSFPPTKNAAYGNMVKEDLEDSGFDMEHFRGLESGDGIKYCEEHLERFPSDDSRIAYKVGQKILKIATSGDGIAQNEIEFRVGKNLHRDEDFLWIEGLSA